MDRLDGLLDSMGVWWLRAVLLGSVVIVGCSDGPEMASVKGHVYYNGDPLTHGSVMFIPKGGPPARGVIGEDGAFELQTYKPGDGAFVGQHRIRVTCYETQSSGAANQAGEEELQHGKSLIPKKYTRMNTSGLAEEVPSGGRDDVMIELFD